MRNKILSLATLAALFFLGSCGNNQQKSETDSTDTTSSAAQEAPKDDGQGVGKFKNINLAPVDPKMAAVGKTVFEAKCTACHRVTNQKIVGPGLKGVTLKQSPAWIMNMITNPQEMTQKDPTAKALLATHLTQMTFQDVSDDQAKEILEYLRQNDAGGAGAEEAKK